MHPKVFHMINALRLIQYAINNLQNDIDEIYLNADIPIFKIFLLLNEDIVKPTNKLIEQEESLTFKEMYLRAMIPGFMINSEFLTLKDAIVQSIKCKMFFEYIENHNEYKILVKDYFTKYEVTDWKEYLKYIFVYYTAFHKKENQYLLQQINHKLPFNHFDSKLKNFINDFIINNNFTIIPLQKLNDIQDNIILRKYPFYLDENGYLVIMNINFLSDHIFQSLYFDFKELVKIKYGEKYAGDFKSIYSYEFSQKILFENVIDYCFADPRYIKKYSEGKGEKSDSSDAYIRKNKRIFLIEYKDYLLSKDLKYSMDYTQINDFLVNRFIEEAGVIQLLKVIDKIEEGGFDFDPLNDIDYFNRNTFVIQPIIVYSDMALEADGINYIINELYRVKLKEKNYRNKINDIVLINIDLLIRFQDEFHFNKINLYSYISTYQGYVRRIQRETPFDAKVDPNEFIRFEGYFYKKIETKNISYDLPQAFKDISKVITDK